MLEKENSLGVANFAAYVIHTAFIVLRGKSITLQDNPSLFIMRRIIQGPKFFKMLNKTSFHPFYFLPVGTFHPITSLVEVFSKNVAKFLKMRQTVRYLY
jgi:hypothetical protein